MLEPQGNNENSKINLYPWYRNINLLFPMEYN